MDSPPAADKFTQAIEQQTKTLQAHPMMSHIYEDDKSFRCRLLPCLMNTSVFIRRMKKRKLLKFIEFCVRRET